MGDCSLERNRGPHRRMFKRPLSTSCIAQQVRSAVKLERNHKGAQSLDRNLPKRSSQKAWERAGESKDEYFQRFAHVHAKQKGNDTAQRRERFQVQRDTKRREVRDESKDQRREHKSRFYKDVYSTLKPNPLSEYVYGRSSVLAVLQAQKRELYNKLYIDGNQKNDDIVGLCEKLNIPVEIASTRHALNLLTNNGVHNGYVLETKPLQLTPVTSLGAADDTSYVILEDNYGTASSQTHQTRKKYPVGLYLDGITDPHNIGALIRSAYFLGVDFVMLSSKNSAPLSPVVAKTAVGSTEFLPVYSVDKPLQFFDKSRGNGWTFISAATGDHNDGRIYDTLEAKNVEIHELKALRDNGPCILVLGSEGEGIRTTLKLRSDFLVTIDGANDVVPIVDSLNVSVAGALLMHKMLGR